MGFPDVYVVGAAKSGTTALANHLKSSKKIFVPEVKEPHFHVARKMAGKIPFVVDSEKDYLSLYEGVGDDVFKVDASVLYLPFYEEAIPSIQRLSGRNARIIIILRDPLERALSAYKHSLRFNADEKLSFNEAVRSDFERRKGNPMLCYKWLSEYCSQVAAYKEAFDNVLVISTKSFSDSPQCVLDLVGDFLGLSDIKHSEGVVENRGDFSWRSETFRLLFNRLFPGKVRYRFRRSFPVFYSFFKKTVYLFFGQKGKVDIEVSEDVREFFEGEKDKVEKYLGVKL